MGSLTVGPATVAAVHRACPQLFLDVHVATDHPKAIIPGLLRCNIYVIFELRIHLLALLSH